MKKRILFGLLAGLVLTMSCNYPETSQTHEVSKGSGNVRVLTFNSDEYAPRDKQSKVSEALQKAVNSGKYNIVSITTGYTEGFLTSATMNYDPTQSGEGNSLRLILVLSAKFPYDDRAEEVKNRLDQITNGGEYNIVDIRTASVEGRIVAAEVYYSRASP